MIYRSFLNYDPPALVALWNAAMESRAAAGLACPDELESVVLAQLYFDPRGLIVACDGPSIVGMAHAGFGADTQRRWVDPALGVVPIVLVHPSYRRRGIGSELLSRAERYLAAHGARTFYAGAMRPLDPFYLGLYGGSELPGVLESDEAAVRFVLARGYQPVDTCVVLQRALEGTLPFDPRCVQLRRRTRLEAHAGVRGADFWWAATFGRFEVTRFRLVEEDRGEPRSSRGELARAAAWDMEFFTRTWGARTAGLIDVEVAPPHRRQGVGRFLMIEVLRRLREEGVMLVEVQTMAQNIPALQLYRSLGFAEVDRGTLYRKELRVES